MKKYIKISSLLLTLITANALSENVVDIGVFYTQDSLNKYSKQEIDEYLQIRTEWANQALISSGIDLKRRIALFEKSPISNPNRLSLNDFFTELLNNKNLFNEYIDKYGLDYITVLTTTNDHDIPCGYANVGGVYSVIQLEKGGCDDTHSIATLAHEWGHLDGADHDTDDGNLAKKSYGVGYYCDGTSTIMSTKYNVAKRHQLYSNPNIIKNNDKCGIEDIADVTRLIKERMEEDGAIQNTNASMKILSSASITLDIDDTNSINELSRILTGKIELSDILEKPVSVQLYTEHVDTDDNDLIPIMDRIVIPAGKTHSDFSVNLLDDDNYEVDEKFRVGIRYGESVSIESEPVEVILKSDERLGISLSIENTKTVFDEDIGAINGVVKLSGESDKPISIELLIKHIDTNDDDFNSVTSVIKIRPGEKNGTFSINIRNDELQESDEKFQIDIRYLDSLNITTDSVTITILDNDKNNQNIPIENITSNTNTGSSGGGGGGGGSMSITLLIIFILALVINKYKIIRNNEICL